MPSLTRFRYAFTPSFRFFVLTFISVSLFISLGFWQLKRADEKKAILQAQAAFSHQAPTPWNPLTPLPKQHQPITIQGHFLSDVLLLDNQHDQHQFGYHVLSPLELSNHQIVVIDRGFIPASPARTELPQIQTPTNTLEVSGTVYYPSAKQWVLGNPLEIKHPHLAMIELLDTQLISHFLHKSVYPFIIRLNEAEPHGYKRAWIAVSMPPERHEAYAFQWFAVAFVIFILFIALNMNKK